MIVHGFDANDWYSTGIVLLRTVTAYVPDNRFVKIYEPSTAIALVKTTVLQYVSEPDSCTIILHD